jgi:GTPase
MAKSGFIAIIGRPNAGKSTLMNLILGEEVAIATSTPQTTRNIINGIHTDEQGQMILVDTPGLHLNQHELGQVLNNYAHKTMKNPDTELIVYVVDVTRGIKEEEQSIIDKVNKTDKPVVLVINKMDRYYEPKHSVNLEHYLSDIKYSKVIKVSAKEQKHRKELINLFFSYLEEGPFYFPEDYVTDQNMRFTAAEIIREQIIMNTKEEVPHASAVLIDEYKELEDSVKISAIIYVERDTQKQILVGSQGRVIKQMRSFARKKLKKITDCPVSLELIIKVKPNWRKSSYILRQLGYDE